MNSKFLSDGGDGDNSGDDNAGDNDEWCVLDFCVSLQAQQPV